MHELPQIVYCHCAFAQVISQGVKQKVLEQLTASGVDFEAIPDLCEMSARRDPLLDGAVGLRNHRATSFRASRATPAVEYLQLQRARSIMMAKLAEATEGVDVYLVPVNAGFGGGGRGGRGAGTPAASRGCCRRTRRRGRRWRQTRRPPARACASGT